MALLFFKVTILHNYMDFTRDDWYLDEYSIKIGVTGDRRPEFERFFDRNQGIGRSSATT